MSPFLVGPALKGRASRAAAQGPGFLGASPNSTCMYTCISSVSLASWSAQCLTRLSFTVQNVSKIVEWWGINSIDTYKSLLKETISVICTNNFMWIYFDVPFVFSKSLGPALDTSSLFASQSPPSTVSSELVCTEIFWIGVYGDFLRFSPIDRSGKWMSSCAIAALPLLGCHRHPGQAAAADRWRPSAGAWWWLPWWDLGRWGGTLAIDTIQRHKNAEEGDELTRCF